MDWIPGAVKDHIKTGGTYTERTDPKGVLHTTESATWPSYDSWSIPPHATIKPTANVGVDVRQHISLLQSAFALRNLGGGIETNRDFVFQFELVGTCDKTTAVKNGYYYWPEADDEVLVDLFKKVILPLSVAYDIPLVARPFQSYPASYGARGNTNTVRLSGADFDTYTGWLGHQHVPENIHGDPGAFPWTKMMKLVTDVALTDAEVASIWNVDMIPAPSPVNPANPTWAPKNMLTWLANQLVAANEDIDALKGQVTDSQKQILGAVAELRAAMQAEITQTVNNAISSGLVSVDVQVNGKVAP